MIAVISTKENKKIAKNISYELEKNNFKVWNYWRDSQNEDPKQVYKNNLNNFTSIIFILNKQALTDSLIIKLYQIAFEQNKEIILFLQTHLDKSLPNWFFLENHDWINAYDVSSETAIKGLIDLLTDINQSSSEFNIVQEKNTDTKKNNNILIGIGIIAVVIIALLLILKPKDTTQPQINTPIITKENPEELLIGVWGLENYQDFIQRTGQDSIQFQIVIDNLKKTFRLKFFPNHTFERSGFTAQVERGYWRLDKQNMYLYLSDINKTGEDRLKILTLTKNQLIFEIATAVSPNKINPIRFTLYKINNQPINNN